MFTDIHTVLLYVSIFIVLVTAYYCYLISSNKVEEEPIDSKVSLTEAKQLLSSAMANWSQKSNFDPDSFRQVANGFFQAEGSITGKVSSTGYISPVLSVNQNFSQAALEFFVTLWHMLGNVGSIHLTLSQSNTVVISWRTESWDSVLGVCRTYFSFIYGEKLLAFHTLSIIRSLMLTGSASNLAEAITLCWSLSLYGTPRQKTLSEVLHSLGLPSVDVQPVEFIDNNSIPSFLFILGFYLGDGTLFTRLRLNPNGSIWVVPMFLLAQLNTPFNKHFLNQLGLFFTIHKITFTSLPKGNGMLSFTVEGISNLLVTLLPMFTTNSQYLYWKYPQYETFFLIARLTNAGAQLTLPGLRMIAELCYRFPNNRVATLSDIYQAIDKLFLAKGSENKSNEYFIRYFNARGQSGWKVVFPSATTLPKRRKQFSVGTYGSEEAALAAAVKYRNDQVSMWLAELNK